MKDKTCIKQLPYLLIGALLTALTLVFPQLGFLQWFTMIPLLIAVYRLSSYEGYTLRKAYGYGFLTIYVYYVVIYHWIVNLYPLDFVGMDNASSLVVIAAGWFGLPLLQAVLGGFIFLLFRLISKTAFFERVPILRPFSFAALWVVFEWSSTIGWTGVPWGRLCLGQIECLPILQSASLFGSYFVSFLLVLVNGLLAYLLLYRKQQVLCGILAVVLFAGNLSYGLIVRAIPEKEDAKTLTAAVIQGNVNSHDKWSSDSYQITRDIYGELTRKAADEGAQLVVWPETAFPTFLTENSNNGRFVSSLAQECDITIIVGALGTDDDGNEYNALFLVDSDGVIHEDFYAKRHLVPFGEYVPMRDVIMTLIPPLANLSALDDDLTPGADSALFETEWGNIGSLICFDSIYEELALASVRDGAELMLISSNDSWFYDSAAVYQHQAQAQLRAIENGRDIVRAANTGISTVISSKGDLNAWIDPLEQGYAVAEVTVRDSVTLYTRIGNLFVYLCMVFVILMCAFEPTQKLIRRVKGKRA